MTTIAFDGKTLAADRASWKGGYIWTRVTKLFEVELCESAMKRLGCGSKVAVAFAGSQQEVPLILEWMKNGGELPTVADKEVGRGMLLDIASRQIYALNSVFTLFPYDSHPVSEGGGHEMVLGAMLAGATASEAIELISKRSSWAAGGVTSFTLPDVAS